MTDKKRQIQITLSDAKISIDIESLADALGNFAFLRWSKAEWDAVLDLEQQLRESPRNRKRWLRWEHDWLESEFACDPSRVIECATAAVLRDEHHRVDWLGGEEPSEVAAALRKLADNIERRAIVVDARLQGGK